MKMFKKIITLLLIQIYLMSNACFALQIMPQGVSGPSDTLSPRVMMSNDALKKLFAPADNTSRGFMHNYFKAYNPRIFVEDDSGLSLQGRVFVEFGIVYHQFGNDLISVVTALDLVDSKEKDAIDKDDLEKILQMSDSLERINKMLINMFNNANIPSLEAVRDIIMQVNGLRTNYSELAALKRKGRLGKGYARILDEGIKCIDFITEHTDAVLFGVKEEKFNIVDLFKTEQKLKILDTEGLSTPELFGYSSGLNFVIKNLRYNLFAHAGHLSQVYSVKITQDDENIMIRFADKGVGFNIENLREKAVELGFWDRARADTARDDEVIDLIFKKGFSRRYEQGTAHGLGLWLCREVLTKYFKGTIMAENAQEQTGAVFRIIIPINRTRRFSVISGLRRILSALKAKRKLLEHSIMAEEPALIGQAI